MQVRQSSLPEGLKMPSSHAHPQHRIGELERELDTARRILAFLSDPDTSIRRLPKGRHQVSHPSLQQLHVGSLYDTVARAAELWAEQEVAK
jgi:hypothetical protein